jgi:hypothetical protein
VPGLIIDNTRCVRAEIYVVPTRYAKDVSGAVVIGEIAIRGCTKLVANDRGRVDYECYIDGGHGQLPQEVDR